MSVYSIKGEHHPVQLPCKVKGARGTKQAEKAKDLCFLEPTNGFGKHQAILGIAIGENTVTMRYLEGYYHKASLGTLQLLYASHSKHPSAFCNQLEGWLPHPTLPPHSPTTSPFGFPMRSHDHEPKSALPCAEEQRGKYATVLQNSMEQPCPQQLEKASR